MTAFSMHIQTSAEISAEARVIWKILTDLPAYAQWNPMLRDVEAALTIGTPVRFTVKRDGGSDLKLKAQITRLLPERELKWRGGNGLLLSGEHYFRIEPLADGSCRFHHGERFRGLLLPLVKPMLRGADRLYQSLNQALRQRAEQYTKQKEKSCAQ